MSKSRTRDLFLKLLRAFPTLDARVRRLRRRLLARGPGYPAWAAMVASEGKPWKMDEAGTNQKILIATSIGSHLSAMQMETTLAAALCLRGADVQALLCDALLPACQMCEPRFFAAPSELAKEGPQAGLCRDCFGPGRTVYRDLGILVHSYSENVTAVERETARRMARELSMAEIAAFQLDGLAVGEHAMAGALRFYASASIGHEPEADPIIRRYFEAALLTVYAADRLMKREKYDVAVFHHGIYVPQGLIGEVARHNGVRVVNWNPAYRRNCFLFSHGDTYHHTLMDEPPETWLQTPWSLERRERIQTYLRSRWKGDNDWIRFQSDPVFGRERILKEIGCDPSKPIIACLTNVMWDAQLHYPANAFANMLEWLLHTIRYFAARPDIQLVIRVHPAELTGTVPTRQPVVEVLKQHFVSLPSNVFVVPPESEVSTYVLAEMADCAVIYGTKTGVELTAVGIPVIVAGEAWIRGKGLTRDACSPEDYDAALSALPRGQRLDERTIDRALRYAYHFFFRRMISVNCFRQGPGWPPFEFSGHSFANLREGSDPGLDCICDGILAGSSFIYDDLCDV